MKSNSQFKSELERALTGLLHHWRVWAADDEIRALHIGFDSSNTEITVSLLTDREPYLTEQGMDALEESRWPAADWRLYGINATWGHRFPDAAGVLDWMAAQAKELDMDALEGFNLTLKKLMFEVATGPAVREMLGRFRRVASPFRVRIEWFFDDEPLDAQLELRG